MSKVTRTDTQPPARHAADSHDLIRVHGARVNNLKDISVELDQWHRVDAAKVEEAAGIAVKLI